MFDRLGSTCNHVAALLFKVDYAWQHGLTQGSAKPCTSMANRWISPAFIPAQAQPLRTSDMVMENPRLRRGLQRRTVSRDSTASRSLFSPARSDRDSTPFTLEEFAAAVFPDCPDAVAFRYSFCMAELQYEPCADVNVCSTVECDTLVDACDVCDLVKYAKQFACSDDFVMPQYSDWEVDQVQIQTASQSDNPVWHLLRSGRISGSIAHEVIVKTRKLRSGKLEDPSTLLGLIMKTKSIDPGIPALKYGRETEPEAANAYTLRQLEKHVNLKVQTCGLFIHSSRPYLCATPDRLVECECCGSCLLEVKCPLSSAGMNPKDFNLPYLISGDSGLSLSRNHKYFAQIQMQMALTKREWCDLYVYSKYGDFVERVYFDAEYWETCQEMFQYCFVNYVLPTIVRGAN